MSQDSEIIDVREETRFFVVGEQRWMSGPRSAEAWATYRTPAPDFETAVKHLKKIRTLWARKFRDLHIEREDETSLVSVVPWK